MHDELDPLLDFGDVLGQRSLPQLHPGTGFIDQVNGFVGQEAVRQIAVRVRHRHGDGLVRVRNRMELLVAFLDAEQNLDRVGFCRRWNLYRLKAALERAVFLDRLAEFGRRGSANALNLAARQGWLEYVGCVERAFRRTGANQRMQLVDEDDGVLRLHQLFHNRLQALFKLAPVFRAGYDQRQVKRQDAFVGKE